MTAKEIVDEMEGILKGKISGATGKEENPIDVVMREILIRDGKLAVCPDCGRTFIVGCRNDVCIDCLHEQGGAN